MFARCLSAIKEERTRASKVIAGPQKEPFRGDKQQFIDDLEQALYASKIISYTQGFMLMRETAKEVRDALSREASFLMYDAVELELELCWHCPHVAWWMHYQGLSVYHIELPGYLICMYFKSVFLGDITSAYGKNPQLESLLFDDFFNKGMSG